MSFTQLCIAVLLVIAMTILFTWMLKSWTDGQSPGADAFLAAASLVAQFLLARRYVENWAFWIVIDSVGIALFWQRGLLATSILYGLFLVMAILGLWNWNQALKVQRITGGVA